MKILAGGRPLLTLSGGRSGPHIIVGMFLRETEIAFLVEIGKINWLFFFF